jgi:hypothetical protein
MVSISVQNAVDMRDLGTATSLTSFFRSMGGSFGVAIMGAILFAGLTDQASAPGLSAGGLLHGGPAVINALPAAARAAIVQSFGHSFRYVYMVGAGICLTGVALAIFMKELPLRRWGAATAPAAAETRTPAPERDAIPVFAKSDER